MIIAKLKVLNAYVSKEKAFKHLLFQSAWEKRKITENQTKHILREEI